MEMNKGIWKKLQEKFAHRNPGEKHKACTGSFSRPCTQVWSLGHCRHKSNCPDFQKKFPYEEKLDSFEVPSSVMSV